MSENKCILDNLCRLLREKFDKKVNDCTGETDISNIPLTSDYIGLDALNLYAYLMVVEEEYSILIDLHDIQLHGFHTLNEIRNLVNAKIA